MTEVEWLGGAEPKRMLADLLSRGGASERKRMLFVCACCRLLWQSLADDRARQLVEELERSAEGSATRPSGDPPPRLDALRSPMVGTAYLHREPGALPYVTLGSLVEPTTAVCIIESMFILNEVFADRFGIVGDVLVQNGGPVEYNAPLFRVIPLLDGLPSADVTAEQAALVRDIFPQPQQKSVQPRVTAPDVLTIAQAAYEERTLPGGELDPVRLAVLADALEEAGASGAILEHLRGPGPHVRGCHVVDALLGKK